MAEVLLAAGLLAGLGAVVIGIAALVFGSRTDRCTGIRAILLGALIIGGVLLAWRIIEWVW